MRHLTSVLPRGHSWHSTCHWEQAILDCSLNWGQLVTVDKEHSWIINQWFASQFDLSVGPMNVGMFVHLLIWFDFSLVIEDNLSLGDKEKCSSIISHFVAIGIAAAI